MHRTSPLMRRRQSKALCHIAASLSLVGAGFLAVSCTDASNDTARAGHASASTQPVPLASAATNGTAADPSTEGSNGTSTVALGDLDVSLLHQEWGESRKNLSTGGEPLSVAGKRYAKGIGTHATSRFDIDVKGATRFTASVGVDDAAEAERDANSGQRSSIEFLVLGDDKVLFRSGVMHKGDAAKAIDVPLAGVKLLSLRINDGGDGIDYDHGDWLDAKLEYVGTAPVAVSTERNSASATANATVLTPAPGPAPRINGARVFGARPGSPVLITIPCTGTKPIQFAIEGQLPEGLTFDAANGRITGSVEKEGEYKFTVRAKNDAGEAKRDWRIVIDDAPGTLAKTPPMGWNSWNVWGMAIDDAKVRAAADSFVSTGLIDHGWTYINIDDGWQYRGARDRDPNFAGQPRDREGRIVSNKKFPDMKALADYVHGKGLKVGLYSSPGTKTCGGVEGSYGYEAEDAARYAEWGFDYLKYDWCSYGDFATLQRRRERSTLDEHKLQMAPYLLMRDELRKQKRDIVYSLCQYGMNNVWEWGHEVDGQLWRTTGDINDSWNSMSGIGFGQAGHEQYAKPGNWNDPDMLVVGYVGWGPNVRPTKLTPDEQYTHMSLWSLLSAPLLIGCDLTRLDPFTIGLLTNDEVIDINQDPLGKQAARARDDGDHEVWAKPLEDGSVAVGLFNRGDAPGEISVSWSELPFAGAVMTTVGNAPGNARGAMEVRDVWRQQTIGTFDSSYKATVPAHGVVLIRVSRKNEAVAH